MSFQSKTNFNRDGFTLVELLVVIGILAIVGVMIIPTVRTLNEDRKIRDTARVVGAMFANARERATVDGVAGVEIVSVPSNPGAPLPINPAAPGPNELRYNAPNMGLILYQLRAIPEYVGDTAAAQCSFNYDTGSMEWRGTFPQGADVVGAGVQAGALMQINNLGVWMPILEVVEITSPPNDPTDDYVVIDVSGLVPPMPPNPVPFKIQRQPVRIESSAVRLPNNLFLNMALSGYGVAPTNPASTEDQWQGRQFRDFGPAEALESGQALQTEGTQFWFASDGSVSRVRSRSYVPSPSATYGSTMTPPTGPIHLLMCSGNRDGVDLTNLDSALFLQDDNNLWITINSRTGSVSMGKMAQVNPILSATNTLGTQIHDARLLARTRRSATP